MEAVPRMPMISLDLKKAGDFNISHSVREFIHSNYSESPEDYSEPLKRLDQLRQSAVSVSRDFEGCSVLRRYLGQLHFLQSRVPMAKGQQAAVPVTWTDLFTGKAVAHTDIGYEQACVLFNLGALHSLLGAVDNRVSEEGMKVSCTHFQCAAGSFSYLRDHYSHSYSSDMGTHTLTVSINLMLAQAQECLLEKSLLDNRKSYLIARISAQVTDYYKACVKAMEAADGASVLGKKEKEWRKLIHMKISYYWALSQLHMGKQSEEQQKYGEAVAYLQNAVEKLNEAIKLSKGQPEHVQEALRFSMDVIGGKFNSAKKDNDFIYHENVPALDTLTTVKGASLVKALPVIPTDPSVTGPDLFSKLVPMAAHEASSLYSEEKAKLLREVMANIESKNEALDQFMDSLSLECVWDTSVFGVLPESLMEKCAALSVKDNAVQSLVRAMQDLAGVNAEVEERLGEVRAVLEEEEANEKSLREVLSSTATPLPPQSPAHLEEVCKELRRYEQAHADATHTNTELHTHMSQHLSNLRLLQGPLQTLQDSLPTPSLSPDDSASLQKVQWLLAKVEEMRSQRISLEQQLRDLIHKDDITSALVTTEHAQMKAVFEQELLKYSQLQGYIQQNLGAQENILKALTDAHVTSAHARKHLQDTQAQWDCTVRGLLMSSEAYEELLRKAEEGRGFYQEVLTKGSALLQKAKVQSKEREQERLQLLDSSLGKAPSRPLAAKPVLERGGGFGGGLRGGVVGGVRSPASLPPGPRLPPAALIPGAVSGPLSWPAGALPAPLDAHGGRQPFPCPPNLPQVPQMPQAPRSAAPLHSHAQPPGAAPIPGQPLPNAAMFGCAPSPWQQPPGTQQPPRHPMMPGGYLPPQPSHMPLPPHLPMQYTHPPPSPAQLAPGPNAPHMPLGPPLHQYLPPHQVPFPGHPAPPAVPLPTPGQRQGTMGVSHHQGVPSPTSQRAPLYPQPPQQAVGYLPPTPPAQPHFQQLPYGYSRLPSSAGGAPGQVAMTPYGPRPPQPPPALPQTHPSFPPPTNPLSSHAPPPHLQQPLVPQQVGAPTSGTTVTMGTGQQGPPPIGPPPANSGAETQTSRGVEEQGAAASSQPSIGAPPLGPPSTEGSLEGLAVDPLQARLQQLTLQPPPGDASSAVNQPSQPINGALHVLHQLEQKNGVVEPAPSSNCVSKHSDLLSDLDPLWSFTKS